METNQNILIKPAEPIINKISVAEEIYFSKRHIKNNFQAYRINFLHKLFLLKISLKKFKSLHVALKAAKHLKSMQKKVWGSSPKKWAAANGKFYYNLYAPAFPSHLLQRMYESEFNRIVPLEEIKAELRLAYFAITKKCPLSCGHCFEWDKLHSKEVLTYDDLRNVIIQLKNSGVVQVHLSGGEPMIRVKEIAKLCSEFKNDMEFFVLTSGFNCTYENILSLKQSGISGMVVSLDHYDKSLHNAFRNYDDAYNNSINAIRYARMNNMVAALSICVTRAMATREHLLRYAELAMSLDISFIQLLEPKTVGNFAGKDVTLNKEQLQTLYSFYEEINFDSRYKDFPIVVYHGYYQEKYGCFSAGNRSLYIDTNGDILFCPFCHAKTGNILTDNLQTIIPAMRINGCPTYGSAKF